MAQLVTPPTGGRNRPKCTGYVSNCGICRAGIFAHHEYQWCDGPLPIGFNHTPCVRQWLAEHGEAAAG